MAAVARPFDGVNRQSLGTWGRTIAPAARWGDPRDEAGSGWMTKTRCVLPLGSRRCRTSPCPKSTRSLTTFSACERR
jgi:hypothetical protein